MCNFICWSMILVGDGIGAIAIRVAPTTTNGNASKNATGRNSQHERATAPQPIITPRHIIQDSENRNSTSISEILCACALPIIL